MLDQHKEKKPKDPTIHEHFDSYRFADYQDKGVDLLMRVTTVSVEMVRITEAMRSAARSLFVKICIKMTSSAYGISESSYLFSSELTRGQALTVGWPAF